MTLNQKKVINRLIIYFFYDADGIVDRYVTYILEDLKKNSSEIFVVCNGKLTPEGRAAFLRLTSQVMVRENEGFDVWAYKEALEHYGWDRLKEYDEVVLMNHTIMGPVYPFSEMFEEMNQRDLDFWGITAFHWVPFDPYGTISYGYIPWHIQSSFIAVRNPMLTSIEFRSYWKSRPPITNYGDAVGKHEAIFTKTFRDKGFACEAYVDTSDLEKYTENPIIKAPVELIRNLRCPIFKRRSFFHTYSDFLNDSNGSQGRELLEYLKHNTDYDIDLIWENIIRTSNLADIKTALHLEYILPDNYCLKEPAEIKIALVMHIYYEEMVEYCRSYAKSMPTSAKIIVTTDREDKAEHIKEVFQQDPEVDLQVLLVKNRGRDVSALLIGASPYLKDYDLVCFMHDKKVNQLPHEITGHFFSERCFQNCLATPEYVQNIVATMLDNPRLGLLCPPPPNFSDYYSTTGSEWGPNFEITELWAKALGIKAVIQRDREVVAPLGTMFWFRPVALKPLLEHDWEYEDFPKEPNQNDGTLLHAIERLYPFAAQSQGYYTAWCMTLPQAMLEWNNLNYMLREINVALFNIFGPQTHWMTKIYLGQNLPALQNQTVNIENLGRIQFKRRMQAKIPKPIWNLMRKIYHLFGGKKWVG